MILKYPTSIPDFLSTCKDMEHKPCFELVHFDDFPNALQTKRLWLQNAMFVQ